MLSGLLKSFDDKPMSQEKRANVNAKLDLGIDKVRGLKRKVSPCLVLQYCESVDKK